MPCALLFWTVSVAAAIDQNSAGLITEIVTTAISNEPKLDVIASADMRRQLEMEADRAVLGCSDDQSCIAELASALGARFVVYGKLGTLDDVTILTLNLFDSEKAQAVKRVAVKERGLSALSDRVDGAVNELVSGFVATLPDGPGATRARVLVLDIEAPKDLAAGSAPAATAASEPLGALFWAGAGGVVVGAAIVGIGGYVFTEAQKTDAAADVPELDGVTANKLYDDRDALGATSITLAVVGAIVLIAGGGVLAYSFVEN